MLSTLLNVTMKSIHITSFHEIWYDMSNPEVIFRIVSFDNEMIHDMKFKLRKISHVEQR